MRSLEIAMREAGRVTVLSLTGRLSVDEESALRQAVNALVQADRLFLVLNLAAVSLIDSAGLGTLVAACVKVRRRQGDVKLVRLTPRNNHAMRITRLDKVFESFASEDEAVASFERRP
jgi:anti-sigma B factor antagonist